MPVAARCKCGEEYQLKDEYAGRLMQCAKCGESLRAEGSSPPASPEPIFDRDMYFLREKHLAISEKYHVCDENGARLLYVERPAHVLRNLLALFAAFACVILIVGLLMTLSSVANSKVFPFILLFGGLLGAPVTFVFVLCKTLPKRHVSIFRDETKGHQLLQILQDQRMIFLTATYTIKDNAGATLARFQKNYLHDILRKRWVGMTPEGKPLFVAKEDSIILSLLRRIIGPLFGLLRTNFTIYDETGEKELGEFNRKFTIFDRYVLDLRADPQRKLDRRIALALGIMLDTGERR